MWISEFELKNVQHTYFYMFFGFYDFRKVINSLNSLFMLHRDWTRKSIYLRIITITICSTITQDNLLLIQLGNTLYSFSETVYSKIKKASYLQNEKSIRILLIFSLLINFVNKICGLRATNSGTDRDFLHTFWPFRNRENCCWHYVWFENSISYWFKSVHKTGV